MDTTQSDGRALLLMGLTVVVWGFSWIVMKSMGLYIGPFDLVTLRYAVGLAAFVVILRVSGQPFRIPPFWFTLGIAIFQTSAFACLVQLALVAGGAAHVTILAYTMPYWAVLFAWALLGERPSGGQAVGLVLAAAGLVAIIGPVESLGSVLSSLLALGGGAAWGLGTVLSKMLFQRHKPNVLSLTMWQMLLGVLLTLPLALLWPQRSIDWGIELVMGLLYMGLLASALGWCLWLSVVRRVSTIVAGMSSLAVPVLVVVLAWLILDERPTSLELAGMALTMAGLVVVNLSPARKVIA